MANVYLHDALWTALCAFLIVMVAMPYAIPFIKKLTGGQTIYELGPQSHFHKQGVPAFGGVIIAAAVLVAGAAFSRGSSRWDFMLFALCSGLLNGGIGFWDDFIKESKHRHEGLTPKQKIALQIVAGALLSAWAYFNPAIGGRVIVPYWNAEWNLSWAYIPIMVFVYVGMTNSANLLDGLDGLEASCSMIGFITFGVVCLAIAAGSTYLPVPEGVNPVYYAENVRNAAMLCAAAAGALLGFLRYNYNPARIFMGDTGAMFVGGLMIGVSVAVRLPILMIPVCAMMIVSSLSDIIQVMYCNMFKGKRLFKMAPLHHHLELCGMSESRIVEMYSIATAVLCLLALLTL